ncbi:MAG: Zn-ribbon domain-containing OB-fold protein [Solimonas sp.]
MGKQIPIKDNLFTWPSATPQLIGGRCPQCGECHFPVQANCPKCASRKIDTVTLGRKGRLWTWTTQGFVPPVPPYTGPIDGFKPFGVGYVELPEGLCVEGRLTVADASKLRIGMEMELVVETFKTDEQGNDILSYAFAPVGA